MKRIARVFPRKTNATPDDELSFIGTGPPLLAMPEIDEVHVSVAFTWDLPQAERLAEEWQAVGVPVPTRAERGAIRTECLWINPAGAAHQAQLKMEIR